MLSVDWDYFICVQRHNWGSYAESKRTINDLWYKRYLQLKLNGEDIQRCFSLSPDADRFWERVRKIFQIAKGTRAYVSDSHAVAYDVARADGCDTVYLFDAHADLGYGGLSSLNFEVNCANWLGKLLKSGQVKAANVIYSPYTKEQADDFPEQNQAYAIRYLSLEELEQSPETIAVDVVHICRSGAWTPPWYDGKFWQFVKRLECPYRVIDCPPRRWDPQNISFSDQINYLLA